MTYRTVQDLVYEAMDKLGVVPAGQSPANEDVVRVTEAVPSIFDQLAAEEICQVPDVENIPSAWFMSLAKIVAYECKEKFGITGEEAADLSAANAEARRTLKIMLRGKPTYAPLQTDWM